MNWTTYTIGKYTEYRLMKGRKMVVQLVPTVQPGKDCWEACWEARGDARFMKDDEFICFNGTAEEAKAEVQKLLK